MYIFQIFGGWANTPKPSVYIAPYTTPTNKCLQLTNQKLLQKIKKPQITPCPILPPPTV